MRMKKRKIMTYCLSVLLAASCIPTTTVSAANDTIPTKLYMTDYTSGVTARQAKTQMAVTAASNLLTNVDAASLSLPSPSFSTLSISLAPTKYDYLISTNAENGATVLTFNSESALKSAMAKIKAEEQSIINSALLPYQNYINTLITNGAYTKALNTDTDAQKTAKLSNMAMLTAAKNSLAYTYTDADLFNGDVTGYVKTYQIGYLSEATIGSSTKQTVVSNDEEFTNFPRLILNGVITEWNAVHHLDKFENSNNSWWYALKDGNTLNNDYYWLAGMMIPNFSSTISFDAYANVDWYQYGNSSKNTTGGITNIAADYYYNANYNYVSDTIYGITNGTNTYYYPNYTYAYAAMQNNTDYYIITSRASTHSTAAQYFCFIDGCYYSSAATSLYPNNTTQMSGISSSSTQYYTSNGNVYKTDGSYVGTVAAAGYSTKNTWFCTSDGKFYSTAQSDKKGYYVTNTSAVDTTDPSYQYWAMRLAQLQKEQAEKEQAEKDNATSTNKTNISNKTDDVIYKMASYVSAETLAKARANKDNICIVTNNRARWNINGSSVETARDVNLNVTYNTKNIPDAFKKVVCQNVTSTSQITVGENIDFGFTGALTIKFKANREGFNAKLYRYDSSKCTLTLVSTSVVTESGYVTFATVSHGGDYLITLS